MKTRSGANMKSKAFEDIDGLIDDALRCALDEKKCRRDLKGTCINLSERGRDSFDIEALVPKLYQEIEQCHTYNSISAENWKLRRNSHFAAKEEEREEVLERRIIQAVEKAGRDGWFNKCSTASGVFTRNSGCHIDLIHQIGADEFELIELKVASDTPLFAAFEILRNGLLYLHARRSLNASYTGKPLLKAGKIRLMVLAPRAYYIYKRRGRTVKPKIYDLRWFEKALNRGVSAFARNDCEMTFAFEAFPTWFEWSELAKQRGPIADECLLRAVDDRQAAFPE